jgi:hypothetical protein
MTMEHPDEDKEGGMVVIKKKLRDTIVIRNFETGVNA